MSERQPHPQTGQPIGVPVDTTPAKRPGPVTLQGRYGRVEKLDARARGVAVGRRSQGHDAHLDLYFELRAVRDATAFSALGRERAPRSTTLIPMPSSTATGRAVGYFTLMEIRPEHARDRGRPRASIRRRCSARRSATEAQYLLARYAFETLGYRRYEWKCNALNAASRRAALRYGFTFEGIFRQHMIAKGRNRDTAWFSMLDSEWPARKRNFERWLAPDNFTADGTAEGSA